MSGGSTDLSFTKFLEDHDLILMEAAVVERLRRSDEIGLHPTLVNAPLIYDPKGRSVMTKIYEEYLDIAQEAGLPMFICTPTWRADLQRVEDSQVNKLVNRHAVHFLNEIRANRYSQAKVRIGGLIGCKNDCYKPAESLKEEEAEKYHSWQIEELVTGGVDFIIAETLPSLQESIGIAKAISRYDIPYFISYVIGRDGKILDGTTLMDAFDKVDTESVRPPIGFMVNCAYPTFLQPDKQEEGVFTRLKGYLANASSLDHCDLDGASDLMLDSVDDWSQEMTRLNQKYGIRILGGCCGTGTDHLRRLVG